MDKSRTSYAEAEVSHEVTAEAPAEAVMMPVPVSVHHPVKTLPQSAQFGIYTTFNIQPGSANAVMILPEDPERLRAVIQVNGSSVVLCNSQASAQSANNIGAATTKLPTNPAGFIVAVGTSPSPFQSQSPVWAVNTDPTTVALVSVCVERINP